MRTSRIAGLPRGYWLIFAVALMVGLLAMLPLGVALDWSGASRMGLTAREARGTAWRGKLTDVSFASMALGDVTTAVSPLGLLTGSVRFGIADTLGQLDMAVDRGLGTFSIVIRRGSFDVSQALALLPARRLEIEDLDVSYGANGCRSAVGKARIVLTSGLGGLQSGDALAGTVRCKDNVLHLDAASQSGAERIAALLLEGRRYRLTVTIASSANPAELARMGFRPGSDGMVLAIDGRL